MSAGPAWRVPVGHRRAGLRRGCRSFANAVVNVLALAWDDLHPRCRVAAPSLRLIEAEQQVTVDRAGASLLLASTRPGKRSAACGKATRRDTAGWAPRYRRPGRAAMPALGARVARTVRDGWSCAGDRR